MRKIKLDICRTVGFPLKCPHQKTSIGRTWLDCRAWTKCPANNVQTCRIMLGSYSVCLFIQEYTVQCPHLDGTWTCKQDVSTTFTFLTPLFSKQLSEIRQEQDMHIQVYWKKGSLDSETARFNNSTSYLAPNFACRKVQFQPLSLNIYNWRWM